MTSPTTIGPEPQHREGRSVRDIVEYSPEQVNEVWCRRIFRQILQSLELQYAMHMPHRGITPDTIVFHDNGKPLLLPLDIGPPDEREAEDLNALARVLHYAITQELVPMGPLKGRVDGYGAALLDAIDRCMDPDPARRPQTIDALRELLGIVPPGAPVRSATPDMIAGSPADGSALPEAGTAAPLHDRAPSHPHDGLPPGGPAAAAPSVAAATAAANAEHGTQGAAHHDIVRDAPPAAGQDTGQAAPHVPDHDDAPDVHAAPRGAGHEPTGGAPNVAGAAGMHAAHAAQPAVDQGANHDSGHAAHRATGHDGTHTGAGHGASRGDGRLARATADHDGAHAVPQTSDTHTAAGRGASRDGGHTAHRAPGHDGAHAVPQVPAHDRVSDRTHATGATAAPVAASTARGIPPPAVPGVPAAGRRRAGLSSRQRWALAAGVAVCVALALAAFSELRDAGPIEHIDLATPQPAGTPAAAMPGAQSGVGAAAAGNTAAEGGAAPAAAAGAGVTAGLAPGETVVPGSAMPAPAAAARPLPGVVVTPQGNVYKLQIQPWGVVYVDGVDHGVSPPVKRLTLAPGRHTLRITNPNFQERVIDVDTAAGDGEISVDFADTPR